MFLALPCTAIQAQPKLQSDTTQATAGYFRLSWTDSKGTFELQQAGNQGFHQARTIYQGPDMASVISGLADGNYYYRVRNTDSTNWSETVHVEVHHHPLTRAFGFFILGAVMFVATLGILLHGAGRKDVS